MLAGEIPGKCYFLDNIHINFERPTYLFLDDLFLGWLVFLCAGVQYYAGELALGFKFCRYWLTSL